MGNSKSTDNRDINNKISDLTQIIYNDDGKKIGIEKKYTHKVQLGPEKEITTDMEEIIRMFDDETLEKVISYVSGQDLLIRRYIYDKFKRVVDFRNTLLDEKTGDLVESIDVTRVFNDLKHTYKFIFVNKFFNKNWKTTTATDVLNQIDNYDYDGVFPEQESNVIASLDVNNENSATGATQNLGKACESLMCDPNINIKDKTAFKKWALKNHPDKGGDEELFAKVMECTQSGSYCK